MANIEVDEVEYKSMQQVVGAVQKMLANPAARKKVLEAQKDINPNAVIPELDATRPFQEAISRVEKGLEDIKKSQEEARAEAEKKEKLAALTHAWEEGRVKARSAGYTKEGLESLEKFMEEKGIADFDVAMAAFEKLNPPAEQVAPAGNRFDVFGQMREGNDTLKALLDSRGEDAHAIGKLIHQTLSEVRTGTR